MPRRNVCGLEFANWATKKPKPGGVDGRFGPKMLVIWMPGPWVTAAPRTGDRPAALSRGGSYWAHRFLERVWIYF